MVDFIEALFNIGFERILGLKSNEIVDGFDSVVGTAAWSETVRVRFKDR